MLVICHVENLEEQNINCKSKNASIEGTDALQLRRLCKADVKC